MTGQSSGVSGRTVIAGSDRLAFVRDIEVIVGSAFAGRETAVPEDENVPCAVSHAARAGAGRDRMFSLAAIAMRLRQPAAYRALDSAGAGAERPTSTTVR